MYKTTFVHRRAAKNGDNGWLSTKLHFFLPPTNYFSMIEAVLIFFCNFVGREGVCPTCDFITA